jgi:cytochrome c553
VLDQVVSYFAALPPPVPQPTSRLSSQEIIHSKTLVTQGSRAEGVPACIGCHSNSPKHDFAAPCLEAQQPGYLEKQLDDFRTGKRVNDPEAVMQKIARRLGDGEAAVLSEYLASLPRGAACGVTP